MKQNEVARKPQAKPLPTRLQGTPRRGQPENYPALVLNADFRLLSAHPLEVMNWQDAVKDSMTGRVRLVELHERSIRSAGGLEVLLPAVVALRDYRNMNHAVAFTRMAVYLRDRFTCAYCDRRLPMRELTFDHVVPRSRGGRTCWTNIVTACDDCNLAKRDRSPEAAGMPLRRPPYEPTRSRLNEIGREFPPPWGGLHRAWLPYMGIEAPAGAVLACDAQRTSTEGTLGAFPASMTDEDYWNVALES